MHVLHQVRSRAVPNDFISDRCQLQDGNTMAVFATQNAYFPQLRSFDHDTIHGVLHDVPAVLLSPTQLRDNVFRKLPFAASRNRTWFLGYDGISDDDDLWLSVFPPQTMHPPERIISRQRNACVFPATTLALSECGTRAAEASGVFLNIYERCSEDKSWRKQNSITSRGNIEAIAFFPTKDRIAVITRDLYNIEKDILCIYELVSGGTILRHYHGIPATSAEQLHVNHDAQTFVLMTSDTSVWSGNIFPVYFDVRKEYILFATISRDFDRRALALMAANSKLAVTTEICFTSLYLLQAFLFAFFEPFIIH
jgi:hypothetical protein